jgi:hypothetical protein
LLARLGVEGGWSASGAAWPQAMTDRVGGPGGESADSASAEVTPDRAG